ncbi:MAG TPA: polyhydroxyalkanoic acid system family protein [Candidatus Paceibacterota bacterium]|nr:polyhydroxyalkanoic acid system family protein [Candidatus Paceibacterota bacterium]
MQVTIPHKDSEIAAITKVKKVLNESRSKLAAHVTDVEEKWEGNVLHYAFTAQGYRITGTLTVKDKLFELYAKLPLTLRLFEGRIQKMIQEQASTMFK